MRNGDKVPIPEALTEGERANFQTIRFAAAAGDLAVISAVRKADGAHVALLCAVEKGTDERGQESFSIVPLAELVGGNPYEDYHDPTVEADEGPAPDEAPVMFV